MKRMHERHVNLMREMDDNYRLIEQETQDYYIEFLNKWKELAKAKIKSYREQCERLVSEKGQAVRQRDSQIETLQERVQGLMREKEKVMRDYSSLMSERERQND
jgi:ElaB/YqjD/DUF883 family membrane-anchored ribosome-binding protein